MTDNRGEVVAYADSADERYVTLIRLTPAEDVDIPLVPQSLLLAAREKNLGLTIAAHGLSQELEARKADLVESQRLHEEALFGWNAEKQRAERAEAELAECRRNERRYLCLRNELYKGDFIIGEARLIFDVIGACPTTEQFDAAIDACVGGEQG